MLKPKHIYQFFHQQYKQGRQYWPAGTVVETKDPKSSFVLEQMVFSRLPKNLDPDKPRFEYLAESIGSGQQGDVYKIDATLKQDHFRYRGKAGRLRAVKFNAGAPEEAEREFQAWSKTPHGNPRKPALCGGKGQAMVLDLMPGISLYDLVEPDAYNVIAVDSFSVKNRLQLTLALLNALKEQVQDAGLVHMDLKPENIRVDMSSTPLGVYIVDFGSALPATELTSKTKTSYCYAPPERLLTGYGALTPKCDVFSIGKIIAQVWGVRSISFGHSPKTIIDQSCNNKNLVTLFTGMESSGLKSEDMGAIRAFLAMMLCPVVSARWSLDTAIEKFKTLDLSYVPEPGITLVDSDSDSDYSDSYAAPSCS